MVDLSLGAVTCVATDDMGRKEIDIKRYAKVEKIPGGDIEDCRVLKGVMFNKDVVHGKMRRKIAKPRILLLDCTLEYKKGESQTQIELSDEKAWEALLLEEENAIKDMCNDIIGVKPDLVVTEKGVSDLAQHYLQKANISVLRRVRKTDNNRVARATGATIVHRTSEIQEKDLGVGCGLFHVDKIGDEYYSWLVDCEAPKACTAEGDAVHKCVYGLYKEISSKAPQQFKDYARCLDRSDLQVAQCKKLQDAFESAYYGS